MNALHFSKACVPTLAIDVESAGCLFVRELVGKTMEYILYCDESKQKSSLYGDFFGGCIINSKDWQYVTDAPSYATHDRIYRFADYYP